MALRVLLSFPDAVGKPGIGSIARAQAEGLVRAGHDVVLTCTSLEAPVPGADVVRTLSLGERRIPHRVLGRQRARDLHDAWTARVLRRRGPFDVVHVWPRSAVRTAAAARAAGVPLVREVPNTHTAHAYEVVGRELAALGLEPRPGHSHTPDPRALALEEREYATADGLLVLSRHAAGTFLARGVPGAKLLLHSYGCDLDRFPPPSGFEPRPGLRAVFLGRCEPRKGLHHALRAWRDARVGERGGSLLIAGRFVPGYREALGDLLAQPGIDVRGWADDPPAVLRDRDVLLLPSVEEGSALVTYEAQASGCALLVSDAAGARCEHGREGLVHRPGDVAELTRHLAALAEDPRRVAAMRRHAAADRARLGWDHAAEELVAAYSRVAG